LPQPLVRRRLALVLVLALVPLALALALAQVLAGPSAPVCSPLR
jgi:hypothetical protein